MVRTRQPIQPGVFQHHTHLRRAEERSINTDSNREDGRPPIAAALGSDERQAARRAVADDAFLCVRLHVEA
jgi:hypothetical protein